MDIRTREPQRTDSLKVAMDVVPVVFGSGKRYFGGIAGQHLLEDPDVAIQGDGVLHVSFSAVNGRACG